MVQGKLIAKIHINNYIRKVRLSEAQREKHYEWDGLTIKCKSKKLLQKYINPIYRKDIIFNNGKVLIEHLIPKYVIIGFKGKKVYSQQITNEQEQIFNTKHTEKQLKIPTKYILCEEIPLGQYIKVLANETQAGKPKEHIINGQAFYNQTLNQFARIKVMEKIKEMYLDKFKSMNILNPITFKNIRNKLNTPYPIQVVMEIQDTVKSEFDSTKKGHGKPWDVGNRAEPYMKGFLDFLVKGDEEVLPLIKDDDRLNVSSGNNCFFTPILEGEIPKLIFYFYEDTRPIWNDILDIDV